MSKKHYPSATADETTTEDTVTTSPEAVSSWQWDGSHDASTWPEWLAGCNVHVHGDHLQLTAPQGNITAAKGEWVTKDEEGNIVVKAAEPA